MPNIIVRAISGAIYVALILGSLLWSPGVAFPLLMMLFAIIGSLEYSRMTGERRPALRLLDMVAAALPSLFVVALRVPYLTLTPAYVIASLLLLYPLIRLACELSNRGADPLERGARSTLGAYYLGIPLGLAAYGAAIMPRMIILMMVMIWLNDTGAYLTGRAFGRTKLMERISPKKTREGAAGGIMASMVAGIVAPLVCPSLGMTAVGGMLFGLVVAVAAIVGDLVESMLKRQEGIKDSGNIIPGHGGILDRIDSLIFVSPITLLVIFWLLR